MQFSFVLISKDLFLNVKKIIIMKILIGIILVALTAIIIYSCAGVSVGVSGSFGMGYYGGPYGWGVHPGVNVGVYGGGYWR